MKLRDHPKLRDRWPPPPESTAPGSNKSPAGNHDLLEWLYFHPPSNSWPAHVSLQTAHHGRRYARDLSLDDALFAERLAGFLRQRLGQSIAELSEVEIDF